MRTSSLRLAALLTAVSLLAVPALAVEGKWTPEQVLQLDPTWLASLGLELPPAALWSDGGGLLEATVKVGGCTGAFISPDGLVVTNHHCAFSLVQHHSTPERDLLADGFLASGREGELGRAGTRVTVPHAFADVTGKVAAASAAATDDVARVRAVEAIKKQLVAECESRPNRRCDVATFDDGVSHVLIETLEFPDVRLVWAPPNAVGDFGGEVDNWSWPRHGGDLALLRVWAGDGNAPAAFAASNTPYRPARFFPVSTEGVREGTFVMVTGYPGRSYRRLTAAEAAERAELYYPARSELYASWIALLERASARSEAAALALAPRIKGLANGEKNARGQIVGIARGGIVDAKRAREAEVVAWAEARPEHAAAVEAYRGLQALAAARRASFTRDFLLENLTQGPIALKWGVTLQRWASESAKPDLERDPTYMERNRERTRTTLENEQKRFDLPADELLLADLLARLARAGSPTAVKALDGREPGVVAAALLAATSVTNPEKRLAMFSDEPSALAARKDPLLAFAAELDRERREREERADGWSGAELRLRPTWLAALRAFLGRPDAPDANGTLRVTFATVQGYQPRDAVVYTPRTRLAGILEKHTGVEPFDAPAAVRAGATAARSSRWFDPTLGDVPVDFLADADTTGGNSGSPVLDGRGRLVGVNFDRVWENVANDFGYNPAVARNVSVDVRYLFWLLETLHGDAARPLLGELGVSAATTAH